MQYMHHKCQLKWPDKDSMAKTIVKTVLKMTEKAKSSGDVHDKWDLIADTERL